MLSTPSNPAAALFLAKSRADRDMRLPQAIIAIDLGMIATKSSIVYLPSTSKPDMKPIPVTFKVANRLPKAKDPKVQISTARASLPTILSYDAKQMSWDASPVAVGYGATRQDTMKGFDIYKHFKISALRDPRGQVASTNGRGQREGGQLLEHFLVAIHSKIEDFFNGNRPPNSNIPIWNDATIHIVLSAPPQAGARGTDALHSIATKVFASPTHRIWPVSISEPEAAGHYVAGEVRRTQPVSIAYNLARQETENKADRNTQKLAKSSTLLIADLGGGTSDLALVHMKKNKPALGTGFIKPVISMHRGGAHIDHKLTAMILRTFRAAKDSLLEGVTPEVAARAGQQDVLMYNLNPLAKSTQVQDVGGVSIEGRYLIVNRSALQPLFDEQISGTPTRPAIFEHLLDMRGDLYAGAPLAAQAMMSTRLDSFVFVGGFGSSTCVQRAVRSALSRGSCTPNAALHSIMSDTVFPEVAHPQQAVAHGLAIAHHLHLLHRTRPAKKALVVLRYMFE